MNAPIALLVVQESHRTAVAREPRLEPSRGRDTGPAGLVALARRLAGRRSSATTAC